MSQQGFTESIVEQAALEWLEALGYGIAHGPEIGCGQPGAERADWAQVVLELRLRQALARLNPRVPTNALLGGDLVRVIAFENPANNDFLAVNQFTVVENKHERRPDVVLFVNGLPLAVIELKNAADEDATIWTAFHQLQTYKLQIPSLFTWNAALVISDGVQA